MRVSLVSPSWYPVSVESLYKNPTLFPQSLITFLRTLLTPSRSRPHLLDLPPTPDRTLTRRAPQAPTTYLHEHRQSSYTSSRPFTPGTGSPTLPQQHTPPSRTSFRTPPIPHTGQPHPRRQQRDIPPNADTAQHRPSRCVSSLRLTADLLRPRGLPCTPGRHRSELSIAIPQVFSSRISGSCMTVALR